VLPLYRVLTLRIFNPRNDLADLTAARGQLLLNWISVLITKCINKSCTNRTHLNMLADLTEMAGQYVVLYCEGTQRCLSDDVILLCSQK
jgi:hypothetical protein